MDDPTTMPPASILIVDDDPENLKLVGGLLSERGYKVRLLSHGQLALRSAQANLHPSDAVVTHATTNAWAIYDLLVTLVGRTVVAHPAKVKLIAEARVKTDKVDARHWAAPPFSLR
jgi:CheY-like chemotaxis protein